jgi:hypothetical protein
MSTRRIVYTNALGDSIEFGTRAYPIQSVEGLGMPGVDLQSQKAPMQDGQTYIDSLFNSREISLEVAINQPKNITVQNVGKNAILKTLNPRLGEGTLVYYYAGGSRQIKCSPYVSFANKDGTDPFQRAQITFTCSNPYFTDVTGTVVNFERASKVRETTIVSADASEGRIIKVSSTTFLCFYLHNTGSAYDLRMKKSTDTGATWGSFSTVVSAISATYGVALAPNGTIMVTYFATYLVSLYSTSNGTSWSSPVTTSIVSGNLYGELLVSGADNSFIAAIYPASGKPDVYRSDDNGTTWVLKHQSATSGATIFLLKDNNDKIYMIYTAPAPVYNTIYASLENGLSWVLEESIAGFTPSINEPMSVYNGNLKSTAYQSSSIPDYAVSIREFYLRDQPSINYEFPLSTLYVPGVGGVAKIIEDDTYIYSATCPPNGATSLLSFMMIDKEIREITINGHADTFFEMSVTPAFNSVYVRNITTGENLFINANPLIGETFNINTQPGLKSINGIKNGQIYNWVAGIMPGSRFINLGLGVNRLEFMVQVSSSDFASANTAVLTYKERYIGL